MPREARREVGSPEAGSRTDLSREAREAVPVLELRPDLRAALRPWVDVDEVGAIGLRSWLLSVLPLLPRGSPGRHVLDRDVSRGSLEHRLEDLAQALAECAGDRATKNFQAAEYFRENRVLARRVKALEAIVRTQQARASPGTGAPADPEAEAATRRYLPRERR